MSYLVWGFSAGMLSPFSPWEPNESEVDLLYQNPKRRKIDGNSTIGVTKCMFKLFTHFFISLTFRFAWIDQPRKYMLHELHCSSLDSHTSTARLFPF
jgi:hypothetical protein